MERKIKETTGVDPENGDTYLVRFWLRGERAIQETPWVNPETGDIYPLFTVGYWSKETGFDPITDYDSYSEAADWLSKTDQGL